jgi:hypothetical protein
MTKINSTGYVITDRENNVIYGHGASVDAAWAEVVEGVRDFGTNFDGEPITAEEAFEKHYRVHGATAALLARVEDAGGAINWDLVSGVACTPAEAGNVRNSD